MVHMIIVEVSLYIGWRKDQERYQIAVKETGATLETEHRQGMFAKLGKKKETSEVL